MPHIIIVVFPSMHTDIFTYIYPFCHFLLHLLSCHLGTFSFCLNFTINISISAGLLVINYLTFLFFWAKCSYSIFNFKRCFHSRLLIFFFPAVWRYFTVFWFPGFLLKSCTSLLFFFVSNWMLLHFSICLCFLAV